MRAKRVFNKAALLWWLPSIRSLSLSLGAVGRVRVVDWRRQRSLYLMASSVSECNLKVAATLGEPAALWRRFAEIASIPRPSGQEAAVMSYIEALAKDRGLSSARDAAGNVVVRVPGINSSAGAVLIQGHVDMVTEKNADKKHDFERDPIALRVAGDWLEATGTTLGADNGIGVAAALALLDEPLDKCPPLELLFTVDEETGLTGARDLDVAALGIRAQSMLNLDTEEWGSLYVGCAGGGDTNLRFESNVEIVPAAARMYQISLKGAVGGHSGIDIHRGRCNAVKALATILRTAKASHLASFQGGDKHNAIPREATAVVAVEPDACLAAFEQVKHGYADAGTLTLNVEHVPDTDKALSADDSARFLCLVADLAHGVIAMSPDIPDLVETSTNVAAVKQLNVGSFNILCSTRSSKSTDLEQVRDSIAATATKAGAYVAFREPAYPGWQPNMNSKLLNLTSSCYCELFPDANPPEVKAIHAGLECGLLIEKIDAANLDAISFGPTIENAHTPTERLNLESTPPFFALLKAILMALA